MCLNLSYIVDYVKLEKSFGDIRVKNEKLDQIDNKEFQTLYDKSKKLIDSARNNMGQNQMKYQLVGNSDRFKKKI